MSVVVVMLMAFGVNLVVDGNAPQKVHKPEYVATQSVGGAVIGGGGERVFSLNGK